MDQVRILLVEDDPFEAEHLQLELSEPEFNFIGVVHDAETLLTRVREEEIDLLIVDIILAGPIDGIDAIQALREFSDVPVIYLTAYDREDFLVRAEATDPSAYLLKPYRKRELSFSIKMARARWQREKKLNVEKAQAEKALWHLATHDALTHLPNRTLLLDRLEHQISHSLRSNTSFAVIFIDVDNFKIINDGYGHETGDRVIRDVASRFNNALREDDTVARIGGDEFVLIAEFTGIDEITAISKISNKICDSLKPPFVVENEARRLSISCGIAIFPKDGKSPSMLLRNADAAMYRAKTSKGNAIEFYSTELTSIARNQLTLENSLIQAIEKNQFEIYYHTQQCLKTSNVYAVEALIRWNRPGFGIIGPQDFIPLAEESGLIVPITEWVFHAVLQQMRKWMDSGVALDTVAVNLSPSIKLDESFQKSLSEILIATGCPADKLELEITESHLIDTTKTAQWLKELKSTGVKISIDDFGTGFSSLSYLKALPVDKLKIDKSFIDDLPHDQESIAITRTILALAKNLNLQTVAEGVEKIEQLELLQEEGCDAVQGFLFSKPMPAEILENFLAQKK